MGNSNFSGPIISTGGFTGDITGDVTGQLFGSLETMTSAGSASTAAGLTLLNVASGSPAISLVDGPAGVTTRKVFKLINGTSNPVLTPGNLRDGTTITFDADNEVAELIWDGSNWNLIYTDATLA